MSVVQPLLCGGLALLLLSGCGDEHVDRDGDGASAEIDCDDRDPTRRPGADELCDGVDNDCDEEVDEDPVNGRMLYLDADSDSFGAGEGIPGCEEGANWVANDVDCDDTRSVSHPGADELCDGLDNNCDDRIDEGVQPIWYLDLDQDGYGDPDRPLLACTRPDGHVSDRSDCDDRAAAVNPDTLWYLDRDEDGYGDIDSAVASCEDPGGYIRFGGDCLDSDYATFPGAAEELGADLCSRDADGDGFGDAWPPAGVEPGTDCLDEDPTVYPGAVAESATRCMLDADGDGYGDASPPAGVTPGSDCADHLPDVNPDAVEICDALDNDCDGVTDSDAVDRVTLYADSDGDGFGDAASSALGCFEGSGYLYDSSDCDDTDPEIRPDALEDCTDGVDNDCDGVVDDTCEYASGDVAALLPGGRGGAPRREHAPESAEHHPGRRPAGPAVRLADYLTPPGARASERGRTGSQGRWDRVRTPRRANSEGTHER